MNQFSTIYDQNSKIKKILGFRNVKNQYKTNLTIICGFGLILSCKKPSQIYIAKAILVNNKKIVHKSLDLIHKYNFNKLTLSTKRNTQISNDASKTEASIRLF